MKSYTEIDRCRVCGNKNLVPILSLGTQSLTGVFPKTKEQIITSGPVDLVRCDASQSEDCCGLVQLRQSYDKNQLYAPGYGYRSGLNPSMVRHLRSLVEKILSTISLNPGDLILDIGSNDSTLLQAYPKGSAVLVGIDPTGGQFKKCYPGHIQLIANYFSTNAVRERFEGKKARIITSVAMFYDLESPVDFMKEVYDVLASDGLWACEQSYLPTMLEQNAYDTICHEHLEYYGLKQIQWMAERASLEIIDVELNDVNGGSFYVVLAKPGSPYARRSDKIDELLLREKELSTQKPYDAFVKRVARHRERVRDFFKRCKVEGKNVAGYGASTKGNVILQFCGLTPEDISCIGEVNEDKFSCFTPGTLIPIVSEEEAKALRPHYLMVFPWHFRDFIVQKEAGYLKSGGRLVFPLPHFESVPPGVELNSRAASPRET